MRVVWITFGYRDWETVQKEIGMSVEGGSVLGSCVLIPIFLYVYRVFKTVAYNRVIQEGDPHEGYKSKGGPYFAAIKFILRLHRPVNSQTLQSCHMKLKIFNLFTEFVYINWYNKVSYCYRLTDSKLQYKEATIPSTGIT